MKMEAPNLNKVSKGYLKKFTPVVNWNELMEDINNGTKTVKLKYNNRPKTTVETIQEILEDGTVMTVDEFGKINYIQSYDRLKEVYDAMTEDKMVNNGWWNKTRIYKK